MKTRLSLEVIDLLLQSEHMLIRILDLILSTLFFPTILVHVIILNPSMYTEYGFIIQWGLENGVVCSHEDQASLSSF